MTLLPSFLPSFLPSVLPTIPVNFSTFLPKLVYIFSILSPPSEFILLIQTIIYILVESSDYDGLNLTDLETSIKSLSVDFENFQPELS